MNKTKRNILTATLALCLFITLTLVGASPAWAVEDVWDGTISAQAPSGDGLKLNPYLITTGAELAWIAQEVNKETGANDFKGNYFQLQNDINLNNHEWTAIGSSYAANGKLPFRGNFDGNGYTISGLKIDKPAESYQGLFGAIEGSVIQNFTVSGEVKGNVGVAGVVGDNNNGIIANVHNAVNVHGAHTIGGIVGFHNGFDSEIINSYNSGNISSEDGEDNDSIGGVVGFAGQQATIHNVYNSGNVSSVGATRIGAIAGTTFGVPYISNAYWLDSFNGKGIGYGSVFNEATANIISFNSAGELAQAVEFEDPNDDTKTLQINTLVDALYYEAMEYPPSKSFHTSLWMPSLADDNDFPVLISYWEDNLSASDKPSGEGTEGNPYLIENAANLAYVSIYLFNDPQTYADKHYKLTKDIDLSDYLWYGIGYYYFNNDNMPFTGTFDGNNKTISGLTIYEPAENNMGLFGYTKGATIKDLTVSGNITARNNVGGVVGYADDGTTITNVTNYCDISGNDNVGGIAGQAQYYTISHANNYGIIDAIAKADAPCFVGGIAGQAEGGKISDSSNYGIINFDNTSAIEDRYRSVAGGIVGSGDTSIIITDVYNYADIIIVSSLSKAVVAGGIAGDIDYTEEIANVYNSGNIYTQKGLSIVGGVVGGIYTKSSIVNAYNTGTLHGTSAGGIAGQVAKGSLINNVYNTGRVTTNNANSQLGIAAAIVAVNQGEVKNAYYLESLDIKAIGMIFQDEANPTTATTTNIGTFKTATSAITLVGKDNTITENTLDNTIPLNNLLTALNAGASAYNLSDTDDGTEGIQYPNTLAHYWQAGSGYPTSGLKAMSHTVLLIAIKEDYGKPLPVVKYISDAYSNTYGSIISTTYFDQNGKQLEQYSPVGDYPNVTVEVKTPTHMAIVKLDTFTISKAAFPNSPIQMASVATRNTTGVAVDLAPVIAALGDENATFSVDTVDASAASNVQISSNNILTYNAGAYGSGEETFSDAIILTATSKNYTDTQTYIHITLTDKPTPILSAEPLETTYSGQPITAANFSLSAKDANNNIIEGGIWEIAYPPTGNSSLINANNDLLVTLLFTDLNNIYVPNYIATTLTINKANPQGNATANSISQANQTLADANLQPNFTDVDGNALSGDIHWEDALTTIIMPNTAYSWTFYPDDLQNYNTISNTVTPYTTGSGSGGGGGGGGGSSTPDDTINSGNELSGDNLQDLLDEEDILTVEGENDLNVKFDTDALDAIITAIEDELTDGQDIDDIDVEFIAKEADPSDLNAAQTITVGDNLVLDLRVLVDGEEFTDFDGGTVSISLPYQLADGETADNIKVYYVDENGNKTLIESSYDEATGILTFSTDHFSFYMVAYEEAAAIVENPFSDVEESDWFYDEVMYAYANGLMNGVSETEFSPNAATNRAMIWTVLARLDGIDTEGGETWYSIAQAWAIENEVSDGENPTGEISREQFATMLYRYAGSPPVTLNAVLDTYSDYQDISDWAIAAMDWAVKVEIISGMGDGSLNPKGQASRAEIATMLMRYLEME